MLRLTPLQLCGSAAHVYNNNIEKTAVRMRELADVKPRTDATVASVITLNIIELVTSEELSIFMTSVTFEMNNNSPDVGNYKLMRLRQNNRKYRKIHLIVPT